MSVNVTMPKLGMTMKVGKVSRWYKNEGDSVEKGENLFEVETEKITNRVESPETGILFQVVVPEGTTVPVGTILAVIAQAGEQPEKVEGLQASEVVEMKAEAGKPQVAEAETGPVEKKANIVNPIRSPSGKRVGC